MSQAKNIIAKMRGWSGKLTYRQQLGTKDPTLGAIRRPDPDKVGFADCTSTIQAAYLKAGAPNPGYYTGDMRGRGSLVTSSRNPNYGAIQAGDIALMQWRNGLWHAEIATGVGTLIGHPGPGKGPVEKNLRDYLAGAAYWEIRRHKLTTNAPPTGGTTTTTNDEDEEMKVAFYSKGGNTWVYLVFNELSGFYSEYSAGTGAGKMPSDYNNRIAKNWRTGSYVEITAAHAAALKRSLDATRKGV